jgi:hypothetical protein
VEEERFALDGVVVEGALVQVVVAVHFSFRAERFVPGEALFAVHTGGVLVAPADAVAFHEGFDL